MSRNDPTGACRPLPPYWKNIVFKARPAVPPLNRFTCFLSSFVGTEDCCTDLLCYKFGAFG